MIINIEKLKKHIYWSFSDRMKRELIKTDRKNGKADDE